MTETRHDKDTSEAGRSHPGQSEKRHRGSSTSRAELLLDLTNRLAPLSSLDEQFEALVEMTAEATGAERGSLFLSDPVSGELHSRATHGGYKRQIRILRTKGIAGHVFTTGVGEIVPDAYADPRFDSSIDGQTDFVTRSILCVPVRTMKGEVIGVIQSLNKGDGEFSQDDRSLLEAMTRQAAVFLESGLFRELVERSRERESEILDVVSEVSSEIQLGPLLQKIMQTVTKMLSCERSTLFLNDEKTNELYTEIGQGLGATKIRLPNNVGIAGAVFTTAKTINIPYAYADLRFSPAFDKETGFFTRSILCVPVINKNGKTIGVTQVLNRRDGPFTQEDETHLRAFTAQVSIGLENAKLFDDMQSIKNYNEGMLESMSNGVVTFDENGVIVTCNAAGLRLLRTSLDEIIGTGLEEFFAGPNAWIASKVQRVQQTEEPEVTMDAELHLGGERISANTTIQPLVTGKDDRLGSMLLIEDISSEKRMKATMSRYIDPSLTDKLLEAGQEILGGQSSEATVLFSDIRNFTTMTEELGPQGTVSLLNDYFTLMVECIQSEAGMLDKFIGDAIMAIFGTPIAHDDDPDRAVRSAIEMINSLTAFNRERTSHGMKPIEIGVGINTGTVVSGNIGSPKRMDYTVIGDGVNLASRLESACKQYGARILVSDSTVTRLRATYRTREVDQVVVKGKTRPVRVHEVLDYHTEESSPNLSTMLRCFKDGLTEYRAGDWDTAIEAFQEALESTPGDRLSQIYVDRCETLKENPPGSDWNGVWVLKSK